ncbi:MAG: hypothetical protein M1820_008078 [Bogoriella megaspora]|nr:MAG: hypothetical protein M1820_008078 [Bogoriella megaspora]
MGLPHFASVKFGTRVPERSYVRTFVALACVVLVFSTYHSSKHHSNTYRWGFHSRYPPTAPSELDRIPQKIWQTWTTSAQSLPRKLQEYSQTWTERNPGYRYELLTDDGLEPFVQEHFGEHDPHIVKAFSQTDVTIFRADFIRYLALYAEGGIYSDIDTEIYRPIDDWIPAEYISYIGLVLGVEYDQRSDPTGQNETYVQLCQWTMMAKPRHPILRDVIDHVATRVDAFNEEQRLKDNQTARISKTREGSQPEASSDSGGIRKEADGKGKEVRQAHDMQEVMDTAGPKAFTFSVLESLSSLVGENISYSNITFLGKPKLIGDVLFLPVSAFGFGQLHSGSKPWGNKDQLITHHWQFSWKDDIENRPSWSPAQNGSSHVRERISND